MIEVLKNNAKTEKVGSNVAPFLRNSGYIAEVKN